MAVMTQDGNVGAPPPLDATELGAYFALIEVAGLLRHTVDLQLRDEGDLSYVQFQLLARLGLDSPTGSERMTDLADGVVYSRSGMTYQASLLEKAGLVTRAPATDDERGVTVTITDAGRERVAQVLPGHVQVIRDLLLQPLTRGQVTDLFTVLEAARVHMRMAPPRSARARRRKTEKAARAEVPSSSGPHRDERPRIT